MTHVLAFRVTALTLISLAACAQETWRDPSKHRVQFATAQEGIRLEVLDWGGSGRPVVLLAGSGNTTHVFDDFAEKLSAFCHVYGITRRGFGESSRPESGYADQRLADDVLQVLESLKIVAPVLVGHSMAGGELTTLGSQHFDRLAGLVYLDAGADPQDFPASDPAYMELFRKLPAPMRTPPPASEAESRSFEGYRTMQRRNEGFAFPEVELRNTYETNPDGTRGRHKTPGSVLNAIGDGQKKRDYAKIRVPVLSFFGLGSSKSQYQPKDAQERATIEAFDAATRVFITRYKKSLLSGVPGARIVDLQAAGHYVFLTREAGVLRELKAFMTGLP